MDKKFSDYEVSSGTLKHDDIASAIQMFAFIENIPKLKELSVEFFEIFSTNEYSELLDEILEEMYYAMDELAEDGYCFGSLEGDGACLGFWKFEDL